MTVLPDRMKNACVISTLDDVCKSLSNLKDAKTGKERESAAHYAQKFEQLYQLLESRVGGTHQENK